MDDKTIEMLHLARYASQHNRVDQAVIYIQALLKEQPQSAQLHLILGEEFGKMGYFAGAIQQYFHALSLAPELKLARLKLVQAFYLGGDNSSALEQAELLIDPQAPQTSENRDPYHFFAMGLKAFIAEENSSECIALLKQGMALNLQNLALNQEVKQWIEGIENSAPLASDEVMSGLDYSKVGLFNS